MQDMDNYTPRCQNYQNSSNDSGFKMRKYEMEDTKFDESEIEENHSYANHQ